MAKEIISRLLAILLLSIPLAYGFIDSERTEQKAVATLSHIELVARLNANRMDSLIGGVVLLFCAGLLYVGFVEGLAYAFRWAWQRFIK
jgi:hypothetical protein